MGIDIRHAGSTLTTVRSTTPRFVEVAEMGRVGSGSMTIDDSAGTLEIIGHKPWRATEDDCAVENIGRGFMGDRRYKRNTARTGPARFIEADLLDLNAKLAFKVLRGSAWRKRPKNDTIADRLTDLLASGFLNLEDNGFVAYPDIELDGGDLRGQRAGDVLTDMAAIAGFNFFAYYDEDEDEASLWFQDSNTSTDWTSTLRISNVLSDLDEDTFEASRETELARSPGQTVSGVWMPYKKGNVYRTRAATEENYEPRDGTAPSANVKRRARARNRADKFLRHHKNEEDRISTTIQVPSTKVNLVRAGQRIECKFSHFAEEGYGGFTWFRVMERTVTPLVAPAESLYNISMVLSPQEEASGGGEASLVQYKMVTNETDTNIELDDPVTVGHILVAALVKNSDQIPAMPGGAGWTLLGEGYAQPGAGQVANLAQHGSCAIYAKVATTTDPDHGRETTPGTRIRWGLYEIAGASLDAIQVFELNRQSVHEVNAVVNMGTFSSPGLGFMALTFPRESGEAGQTILTTFADDWTEDFDNYLDPDAFGNPWVAIGHGSGEDLQAAATATETVDDQFIAEAGGVAVLFE